jgi:hypothetical protein
LLELYAGDHLRPITSAERHLLPEAAACINCGLCAAAVARVGRLRPSDLASAYLRDYPLLANVPSEVGADAGGEGAGAIPPDEASLAAARVAAAACPTGVPLEGVLAMVRRLASA